MNSPKLYRPIFYMIRDNKKVELRKKVIERCTFFCLLRYTKFGEIDNSTSRQGTIFLKHDTKMKWLNGEEIDEIEQTPLACGIIN
jgi:hypothetical protein